MAKDVLHVVPHNEAWAVKREGNERPSTTHDTQRDAIESARNLAKEGDDIVIHRPDGTIRERSTYMMTQEKANGSNRGPVRPSDVFSVGSRVSWSAVLAGAVIALTTYLSLLLLSMAIGFTTFENLQGRNIAIPAAIVMTVGLLASLFLGGYVASLTTAGENHREAVIYGVLVWGTMFGLSLLIGSAMTTGLGSILGPITQGDGNVWPSAEVLQERLKLSEEQVTSYQAMRGGSMDKDARAALAWWAFASLVLSLLSAMAGSYLGAGPEFVFQRIFVPRTSATGAPNTV